MLERERRDATSPRSPSARCRRVDPWLDRRAMRRRRAAPDRRPAASRPTARRRSSAAVGRQPAEGRRSAKWLEVAPDGLSCSTTRRAASTSAPSARSTVLIRAARRRRPDRPVPLHRAARDRRPRRPHPRLLPRPAGGRGRRRRRSTTTACCTPSTPAAAARAELGRQPHDRGGAPMIRRAFTMRLQAGRPGRVQAPSRRDLGGAGRRDRAPGHRPDHDLRERPGPVPLLGDPRRGGLGPAVAHARSTTGGARS